MGISPSTTWTCLSKFKCSVWSFVAEVPGGDDAIDKWRKNRLFNLPPQHGTPAPLVAKEHPRRMTLLSQLHLEIDHLGYSKIESQVQLLVIRRGGSNSMSNKWRKGPVEPKCHHTGTKLPSGSGSTSGGAFRSSQNLGSGGTCYTKHAVRSL